MPTTQQNERSSYRFLDPVVLPLLSQPHSTALASAKRYDNRYEAEYPRRTSENSLKANFRECPKGEVRRIPIPRTPVNKGKKEKKGRDIVAHILASSK